MAREIYIRVLGPIQIEIDRDVRSITSPQTNALLSLLLLHRGHAVGVDRLIDELWEGRPSRSARAQLHTHVSRIRRVLGPGTHNGLPNLQTVANGYILRMPATSVLDLDDFHTEIGEARYLLESGQYALASRCYRCALNRWHGSPFLGVSQMSVRHEAAHLEELRAGAIEDLVDAALGMGDWVGAIEQLREPLAEFPYRERPRKQLMTALNAAGRSIEALEVYRDYTRTLASDLGVEPSRDLQYLHQAILRGEDHGRGRHRIH